MGDTHYRSNLIEKDAGLTASFTNLKGDLTGDVTGAVTGDVIGNVTGNLTGDLVQTYVKLGTLYIITGNPDSFDNAGINVIATPAVGVLNASDIPVGCLFMNASSNIVATDAVYVKVGVLGSWGSISTGALL